MADLVITAANIVKGAGAIVGSGVAGVAITAGQSVYLDAATNLIKLANANSTPATAAAVGVALNGASTNQPVNYQISGVLAFGAILTVGKIYVVSGAVAGNIAPAADLTTGWTTCILGVAISTSNLQMLVYDSLAVN